MFDFLNVRKLYKPSFVKLEACSACNLRCKECYMRKNEKNPNIIKPGYLKAKDFESFLIKNPFVKQIELSDSGEIFLNPELGAIIRCATFHNVSLTCNNGCNFNRVSDDILCDMVVFGSFKLIRFSIDGASPETYSKYRVGGDFNKVIQNIKKLNAYKKEYNSETPLMVWQYIIMESNCDIEEIRKAKRLASELNMQILFKKDYCGFIPENKKEIFDETGISYDNDNLFNDVEEKAYSCIDSIMCPQTNYDGKFLFCCFKFLYEPLFDLNVFELGLEKVLRDKRVKTLRKLLMGKIKPTKEMYKQYPCLYCDEYKKMIKHNRFVKESDLKY